MSSNEVMDTAVQAYQDLGGIILRYTALPTLLCLAAVVFITSYVLPALGVTNHANDIKAQVGEAITAMAVGLVAAGPLFLIGISYSSAFVCGVVSDFATGEVPDPSRHAKRAFSLLPRLFRLTLFELLTSLLGFAISAGLFMLSALLSVAGTTNIYAAGTAFFAVMALFVGMAVCPVVLSRQALAVPVCVIEGLSAREASKRSKQLLKAQMHHLSAYGTPFSTLIMIFILALFILVGIGQFLGMIEVTELMNGILSGSLVHDLLLQTLHYLPWYLTILSVVPVWCTTVTILYYERRTRLEGYDVEALAQDLLKNGKQNRFEL